MDTDLAEKMIKRADYDGLAADHELRVLAEKFNSAAKGYWGDEQTCGSEQFLGCWARARRAWCNYTGEQLV